MKIIINAEGGVLGRISSYAAKQALLGKEVEVVNCEKALINGVRETILSEYKAAMYRGGFSQRGPYFEKRSPERLMKRTIRGMLSYKQQRGLDAFNRIKCHKGVPKALEGQKMVSLKRDVKVSAMQMSELSKLV